MINSNYFGGLENTDSVKLTATTITDIYEATSNTEICGGFCIVNEHSSAVDVSIYRHDGSTDVLFWKKSIASDDTVIESEIPRWLREGYKIKAQASVANVVTVTPTILIISTNAA